MSYLIDFPQKPLSSKSAAAANPSVTAAPCQLPLQGSQEIRREFRHRQERIAANPRNPLGPFVKGAVSEADWGIADEGLNFGKSIKRSEIAGVGFLSISVRKTDSAAQSLSHGCAVPAPFTREPRLQWCFMASKGTNSRERTPHQKAPLCKRSWRRRRLRNCRT